MGWGGVVWERERGGKGERGEGRKDRGGVGGEM